MINGLPRLALLSVGQVTCNFKMRENKDCCSCWNYVAITASCAKKIQ